MSIKTAHLQPVLGIQFDRLSSGMQEMHMAREIQILEGLRDPRAGPLAMSSRVASRSDGEKGARRVVRSFTQKTTFVRGDAVTRIDPSESDRGKLMRLKRNATGSNIPDRTSHNVYYVK